MKKRKKKKTKKKHAGSCLISNQHRPSRNKTDSGLRSADFLYIARYLRYLTHGRKEEKEKRGTHPGSWSQTRRLGTASYRHILHLLIILIDQPRLSSPDHELYQRVYMSRPVCCIERLNNGQGSTLPLTFFVTSQYCKEKKKQQNSNYTVKFNHDLTEKRRS